MKVNVTKSARRFITGLPLVLGISSPLVTLDAAAETYRYATFVPSTHVLSKDTVYPFAERVKEATDGKVTYKVYDGGVLVGAKNVAQGLRDGVVDMGIVVYSYYPSEFPYNAFVTEMGVEGSYPPAVTAAATEMLLLHCPECLDEIKQKGLVIFGSGTTPPKNLLAPKSFADLDSLKGAKIRTSGAVWDRWLRSVGAVPVAMSSAEQYEALSRGQIDGVMSAEYALKGSGLWDVAKDVTVIHLGMNPSLAVVSAGQKHWKKLDADERAAVMKSAAMALLDMTLAYMAEDKEVQDLTEEKGLTFHQPSEGLQKQMAEFKASEYETVKRKAMEKYNISNPEPVMDTYIQLVEKWEKLYAPVQGDKEKMFDLLWGEVYSKVDPATFGL